MKPYVENHDNEEKKGEGSGQLCQRPKKHPEGWKTNPSVLLQEANWKGELEHVSVERKESKTSTTQVQEGNW